MALPPPSLAPGKYSIGYNEQNIKSSFQKARLEGAGVSKKGETYGQMDGWTGGHPGMSESVKA